MFGFILLFSTVAASASSASRAAADRGLKFVDLIPAFNRAWSETKDLPDEQRIDRFEAGFAKILPGFYAYDQVKQYYTAEKYRAHILKGLKEYPERRAGVEQVSRQFRSLAAPAQRQFEAVFGPMRGYPPVYLVNSFGEFDGGTRDLPEGNRLLFGADTIARLYQGKPIKPLIEHELFHLMHHRTFPECDPVWCNLWEEGLATYVATRLNPGEPDDVLGLALPSPLRPAVESHRQEAICAVRARLSSTKVEDYAPLFTGGGKPLSSDLPNRFGYYVGLLVAEDAGRTMSLKELAALSPEQARALVEQSLARMADCPADAPGPRVQRPPLGKVKAIADP